MLLENFFNNAYKGNAFTTSRWERFLDSLAGRMVIRRDRFMKSEPMDSGIMRLIKALLYDVDVEYLLTFDDDMDIYFKGIMERRDLFHRIDTTIRGSLYQNVVYSEANSTPVKEMMVPAGYKSPVSMLPFDQPWEQMKHHPDAPINILFTNTNALPKGMIGDAIKTNDPPNIVGVGVNLPLLILQWCSYTRSMGKEWVPEPSEFIHEHVVGQLTSQLVDFWILGILKKLAISIYTYDDPKTITEDVSNVSWVPDKNLEKGIQELQPLFLDLSAEVGRVEDFFVTPFFPGKRSLFDYISNVVTTLYVPEVGEYEPVAFLRDVPWLEFILQLFTIKGIDQSKDTALKSFIRDFNRLERKKIENRIEEPEIRDIIQNKIFEISMDVTFVT